MRLTLRECQRPISGKNKDSDRIDTGSPKPQLQPCVLESICRSRQEWICGRVWLDLEGSFVDMRYVYSCPVSSVCCQAPIMAQKGKMSVLLKSMYAIHRRCGCGCSLHKTWLTQPIMVERERVDFELGNGNPGLSIAAPTADMSCKKDIGILASSQYQEESVCGDMRSSTQVSK